MKAIGIGCFHFGIKFSGEHLFSTKEHIEEIRRVIGQIPAVGEISVTYNDKFEDSIKIKDAPAKLNDGTLFPVIMFLNIEFTLYIPSRVQSALVNESWAYKSTGTEKFKIHITDTFYGPVTFVESIDATQHHRPSYAIKVVRRFLESELQKINTSIEFDWMGPSPFHVNLFLKNADEKITEDFIWAVEDKRGYDSIFFRYNGEKFADEQEAFKHLIEALERELGLFYAVVREKNAQRRAWEKIQKQLQHLEQMKNAVSGIRGLFHKYAILKKTQKIIDDLYKFKADNELCRHRVEEWIEEFYAKQLAVYLRKYVERRAKGFPHYPMDSICDWLKHVEGRSLKHLEIGTVFVTAVFGVIAGSAITLLVKG